VDQRSQQEIDHNPPHFHAEYQGTEGIFNSSAREGVFEPLLKKAYFKKLFVDGWTISWPNGADLAPETLYELVELSNSLVNEK